MDAENTFVLDGSVALAWFFKDESNPYANRIARVIADFEAVVPSIWSLELANAVLMGERRGRCTEEQASSWWIYLETLCVRLDQETHAQAWKETVRLARAWRLTVYDASYLELALRRGLPIATLDEKLRSAAGSCHIVIFDPAV